MSHFGRAALISASPASVTGSNSQLTIWRIRTMKTLRFGSGFLTLRDAAWIPTPAKFFLNFTAVEVCVEWQNSLKSAWCCVFRVGVSHRVRPCFNYLNELKSLISNELIFVSVFWFYGVNPSSRSQSSRLKIVISPYRSVFLVNRQSRSHLVKIQIPVIHPAC